MVINWLCKNFRSCRVGHDTLTKNKFENDLASELGGIFLLVGLVTMVILAFSLSLFRSQISLARIELQTAADAASVAAAGGLCPRTDCWNDIQSVALEVLNEHISRVYHSPNRNLVLTPKALDQPLVWNLGESRNLEVTIERGRWTVDARGIFRFEALEDPWQASNPGIPKHVAANAVSITIARPTILGLFGALLGKTVC